MTTDILVPELGESVVEATVGEWRVKVGDPVNIGDVVVELETDKVDVEVGATAIGVLTNILQPAGSDVKIGDVLGTIDTNGATQGGRSGDKSTSPAPANTAETTSATVSEKKTPHR